MGNEMCGFTFEQLVVLDKMMLQKEKHGFFFDSQVERCVRIISQHFTEVNSRKKKNPEEFHD